MKRIYGIIRRVALKLPRSGFRRLAPALAVALALSACGRPPSALEREISASVDRGLACVAHAYDGNDFDDDYLRYVYPGESLESPLPGYRVTYRLLDAYFIVLMIRQAGIAPAGAGKLFARAEALTTALAPSWQGRGIYNLRQNPDPDGIALDSYAILALLRHDAAMARVVERGLDGNGWLAADFYKPPEAFRRLADETWAARAVLIVNPSRGERLIRTQLEEAARAMESEKDLQARANLAIHALLAANDLARPGRAESQPAGAALEALRAPLRRAACSLLGEETLLEDTLTLANLVESLLPDAAVDDRTLSGPMRTLLSRQDAQGCWRVAAGSADASGRVFATLRVVLALGKYRNERLRPSP